MAIDRPESEKIIESFGLLDHQLKYFDAIYWLINSGRSSGKTYLIACVLIKTAMDHPGEKIKIIDHSDLGNKNNRFSHKYVVNTIQRIVNEEMGIGSEFEYSKLHNSITYNP